MTLSISPLLIPRLHRVLEKRVEAPETVTLRLVPLDGDPLPFEPAQVCMLGAFGVGEAAISISSSPAETDHHEFTIRRAGAISGALIDTPVGGVVTVRGPFGTPWPFADTHTPDLLIVAGGLGMAPLKAAIERAIDDLRFERVVVVQGATAPNQLLYADHHDRWQRAGADVITIVDAPSEGWSGRVGLVTEPLEDLRLHLPWEKLTAFICGPDRMMTATMDLLARHGVADERIWLTLERNMQCGNGLCGHCQLGPFIVCRDGPVANARTVRRSLSIPEL